MSEKGNATMAVLSPASGEEEDPSECRVLFTLDSSSPAAAFITAAYGVQLFASGLFARVIYYKVDISHPVFAVVFQVRSA